MPKKLYLNKRTFFQKLTTYIFLIIGIGLNFFNLIICGILSLIIGLITITRVGLEFDFEKSRYREYYEIFGIFIGRWYNYPEIKYISVFKSKVVEDEYPQNRTFSYVIKVNLFYGENEHISIYQGDEIECFKVAEFLKNELNVEILDAT